MSSKLSRLSRYPRALKALSKMSSMGSLPSGESQLADALLFHAMEHLGGKPHAKNGVSSLAHVLYAAAALYEHHAPPSNKRRKPKQRIGSDESGEESIEDLERTFKFLEDPEATLDTRWQAVDERWQRMVDDKATQDRVAEIQSYAPDFEVLPPIENVQSASGVAEIDPDAEVDNTLSNGRAMLEQYCSGDADPMRLKSLDVDVAAR